MQGEKKKKPKEGASYVHFKAKVTVEPELKLYFGFV